METGWVEAATVDRTRRSMTLQGLPEQTVYVTIEAYGSNIDVQQSYAFVKAIRPYDINLEVVSTSPKNNENNVSIDTKWVSVTFNQEMKLGHSVSSYNNCWPLSNDTHIYWSNDHKTFYVSRDNTSENLPHNEEIAIILNPETHFPWFQSKSGVPLEPYTFSFTTEE